MARMVIFILVCLILYLSGQAECIRCYACADSGKCETDLHALTHSRDHGGYFIKSCSTVQQRYCMIESVKKEDKAVSFIRDCSDGKTFSYNNIPRLKAVLTNNQTTCSYYQAYVICVAVCKTDYCNGPQGGVSGSSRMTSLPVPVILLLSWILMSTCKLIPFLGL